jgi:anthranilate phosphoribosyltransferase
VPDERLTAAIERLLAGEDLGADEAAAALEVILAGEAEDIQTAAFLVALRAKGESAAELAGLARAVRARAVEVHPPSGAVLDTCGTGGGRSTFNISTATAFVVAGAGVPVAKHGNRSATSRCGSADVLEALGARIDLDAEGVARCLEDAGVGFMFAPTHHPAFRHVAPVRHALGVRTTFNLLGPLCNPASAPRQLIGVSEPAYIERMGHALLELGGERALLVSSRDGLDELSTGAVSDVVELVGGAVRRAEVDPLALGFSAPEPAVLAGGEPEWNASVLRDVLGGDGGAPREVVVLNAGAALWLAGAARGLEPGLSVAEESLRSGAARERLAAFVAATHRYAPAAAPA